MKLWEKLNELDECLEDMSGFNGEPMSSAHCQDIEDFLENVGRGCVPKNQIHEYLTERQVMYIEQLWEIYCNGGSFEEF